MAEVRVAATGALLQFADGDVLVRVVSARLEHQSADVRCMTAAVAAFNCVTRLTSCVLRSRAALFACMQDSDVDVRRAAASAPARASECGKTCYDAAIQSLWVDGDLGVRQLAATGQCAS